MEERQDHHRPPSLLRDTTTPVAQHDADHDLPQSPSTTGEISSRSEGSEFTHRSSSLTRELHPALRKYHPNYQSVRPGSPSRTSQHEGQIQARVQSEEHPRSHSRHSRNSRSPISCSGGDHGASEPEPAAGPVASPQHAPEHEPSAAAAAVNQSGQAWQWPSGGWNLPTRPPADGFAIHDAEHIEVDPRYVAADGGDISADETSEDPMDGSDVVNQSLLSMVRLSATMRRNGMPFRTAAEVALQCDHVIKSVPRMRRQRKRQLREERLRQEAEAEEDS